MSSRNLRASSRQRNCFEPRFNFIIRRRRSRSHLVSFSFRNGNPIKRLMSLTYHIFMIGPINL